MALSDYYGRDKQGESVFESDVELRAGAIAGFVATAITAVVLVVIDPELLTVTIPGLWGLSGLGAGLVIHLLHGTLFGLVFAVVLADPSLVRITDWLWKTVIVGLVYGLVLAVVATGIILPAWLQFLGLGAAPEIPFVTWSLLVWHILYGLVLGVLFPFAERR